jgi:hypothetical protein
MRVTADIGTVIFEAGKVFSENICTEIIDLPAISDTIEETE